MPRTLAYCEWWNLRDLPTGARPPSQGLDIAQRRLGAGYVTVSGASTERYRALPYVTPTYYAPLGLYNRFAAAVKAMVRIPVIVAGRVVHPAQAEEVLAQGWADAVAMTRALIADHEMPQKAAAGR